MTQDVQALAAWALGCLILAAIFTTAFPILYAFAPWYSTRLGRGLMLQGIAFALAIDLTLLFTLWRPHSIVFLYWVNDIVLSLVAFATGYLTWKMIKHNVFIPLHKNGGRKDVRYLRAEAWRRFRQRAHRRPRR